jgi:uncharacterized protein HemY
MIRLLFAFILTLGSVYLGLQLHQNPGYILIAFGHWTIETTPLAAIFAILFLYFLISIIRSLLKNILNTPSYLKNKYQAYRATRKEAQLKQLESARYEQKTYLSSIVTLAEQHQTQALEQLMKRLPKSLNNNLEIQTEYVRFLLQNYQHTEAESFLRAKLRKNPLNEYIELYGLCHANDSQQLLFAESLLKKKGPSSVLYLCLGRLCMMQNLWGKAKDYLEKSITLQATPEAYKELGLLYEALNDEANACLSYKEGLQITHSNTLGSDS